MLTNKDHFLPTVQKPCPYSAKLASSVRRKRQALREHTRLGTRSPRTLLYCLAPYGLSSRKGLVPGSRVSGGVRKTLLPTLTAAARYSGAGRPQRWHSPARIWEGRNASRQALYPSLQAEKECASLGPVMDTAGHRGRDGDPRRHGIQVHNPDGRQLTYGNYGSKKCIPGAPRKEILI